MKRKILAVSGTVLTALVLATAGCGSIGPDLAASKSAMQAQYAKALADPSAPPAAEPAACKGVPAAALAKFAAQVMSSLSTQG